MGAFDLRFPGPKNFAPALRAVALVQGTMEGLNTRFAFRLDFSTKIRQAPRTLHPRKGAAPAQPTEAEVIGHFIRARDMLQLSESDKHAITQAMLTDVVTSLRAGGTMPTPLTLMTRAGYLARGLWVHRWERGGDDLSLRPLTARYRQYKSRLGYPSRIGTLTGQSLAALKRVRVVAVRVG